MPIPPGGVGATGSARDRIARWSLRYRIVSGWAAIQDLRDFGLPYGVYPG